MVLGASEYPQHAEWTNPVLGASARAVRDYLRSPSGLAMLPAQLLDLFDADGAPSDQLARIEEFLHATGPSARDLVLYYVGHGDFDDYDHYGLGIRATVNGRKYTLMKSLELARAVRRAFGRKRIYVIYDSCFAASALPDWQGTKIEVAAREMSRSLPEHGIAFFAAASKDDVTSAPKDARYTLFTGAVLDALNGGVERDFPRISLHELHEQVRQRLERRSRESSERPQLHCPNQPEGDVSRLGLFPNPAYQRLVEARRVLAEAEARAKAAQEAAEAEARAKAEEVRAAGRAREFLSANFYNGTYRPVEIEEIPLFANGIVDDSGPMPVMPQMPRPWSHVGASPVVDELPFASPSVELQKDSEPSVVPAATANTASPTDAPPTPWAVNSGRDEHGPWAAIEVAGVRQRMRWIPPGRFLMVSPETEFGRYHDEGPQHAVTLTEGYWLGDTPVTQALWRAVMGNNPSRWVGDDRPVENVCWDDCQMFIDSLNRKLCGFALRLPTEPEWELGCRGATQGATWVGELSGVKTAPELEAIAWYGANSGGMTHPVAGKAANPLGLYDMLGNVWEWCAGEKRFYTTKSVTNPKAASKERRYARVYRGGSWSSSARYVRAASRYDCAPSYGDDLVGFRLAGGQASRADAHGT